MDTKILIIDDDVNICELMSLYFLKEGFKVDTCNTGDMALKQTEKFRPSLIVLDVMLPDKDGYQILRELRGNKLTSKIPVIMLTAKSETFDKVLGLELGADDYMVKPFDGKELVARVHAVLRRYSVEPAAAEETEGEAETSRKEGIIEIPHMVIDENAYYVTFDGKKIDLPPKEFELLTFFVKNPNRVFTREQLLDEIWGFDFYGGTRTVDVHIKRLREKFSVEEWGIKTIWSVGYKFEIKD